jgi:cytochrome c553
MLTEIGAAARVVAILAAASAFAPPAGAQPEPPRQPVPRFLMACAPCHGYDGIGHDAQTPNLAGQNAVYLYNQMMAFRSTDRKHPEMYFFATQMTYEEMRAIADYYSKLTKRN